MMALMMLSVAGNAGHAVDHPESKGPHGLVWHNGKYVQYVALPPLLMKNAYLLRVQ